MNYIMFLNSLTDYGFIFSHMNKESQALWNGAMEQLNIKQIVYVMDICDPTRI